MNHVQALAVARDGTSVGIELREAAIFLKGGIGTCLMSLQVRNRRTGIL